MNRMRILPRGLGALVLAVTLLSAGSAHAIPALQLGPGGTGSWTYDLATQTWVASGGSFQLAATANATAADGGNGAFAWEAGTDPSTDPLVAYLVVSAMPKQTDPTGGELFDVTISNASFLASGFGAPPFSDPNDLGPHGIFDTYFEIYTVTFDGDLLAIADTKPGESGSGMGYLELFDVTVGSLPEAVDGLHFDLYTLDGSGQVAAFAPFSHDAQYLVPEPGAALLFGVGALVASASLRRRRC